MFVSRLDSEQPEIFASIQGEGISAGTPSVFVRLSRCNLQCRFCDTPYTWDWSRFDVRTESFDLDVDDIAERARSVAGASIDNVVLTGGEPLVQARPLAELAERLAGRGFRLEVETNGTLVPPPELASRVAQWNVSPKLAGAGDPAHRREVPGALRWFAARPEAFWKIVVAEPAEVDEATALVERYGVPADRVLLMPEGTDAETLNERGRWLAARCAERGYRFGTRLHVYLWGAERGR